MRPIGLSYRPARLGSIPGHLKRFKNSGSVHSDTETRMRLHKGGGGSCGVLELLKPDFFYQLG